MENATKNMELWNAVCTPPPTALKTIAAGRLKGKSDINPQWRILALTNAFGVCGIGWKYDIVSLWTEPGSDSQVFCFAKVCLYVKNGEHWSDPIPGVGGSMLIAQEKAGMYSCDEAYKMAITDAFGVACKYLGIAASVYLGRMENGKYDKVQPAPSTPSSPPSRPPLVPPENGATAETAQQIFKRAMKISGGILHLTEEQIYSALFMEGLPDSIEWGDKEHGQATTVLRKLCFTALHAVPEPDGE